MIELMDMRENVLDRIYTYTLDASYSYLTSKDTTPPDPCVSLETNSSSHT